MELCGYCYSADFCRNLTVRLVTDAELDNTDFHRDLRNHAYRLHLSPDRWATFLIDTYRDYPGTVRDGDGAAVDLNLKEFDDPNLRYWFRDTICTPLPAEVTPRVRCEARERFRILATLLKAIDPVAASLWGVRGANDSPAPSRPAPLVRPAQSCPYPRLFDERRARMMLPYRRKLPP